MLLVDGVYAERKKSRLDSYRERLRAAEYAVPGTSHGVCVCVCVLLPGITAGLRNRGTYVRNRMSLFIASRETEVLKKKKI